jgi:hypothetical protein
MLNNLRNHKRAELLSKNTALSFEFEHWRKVSAQRQPFEKHDSQIRRITSRIQGLIDARTKELSGLADSDVLVRSQTIEEKILASHLVWEFFRSRLALRADEHLRPYLQACDEFAWSCYESPRQRFFDTAISKGYLDAALRTKEPPLVYLNGGWSPFAVSREMAFELDRPKFDPDRSGTSWLASLEFKEVMQSLPVPLIGMPWYQVNHLPDVLVLGHEMGHVVEWDFGLSEDIERAVSHASVNRDRRAAWLAWRREVFADVFGCLAGGPRFGSTLAGFLATDEEKVRSERRSGGRWGEYPMRWLRVEIVSAAIAKSGFPTYGEDLRREWQSWYGLPETQANFEEDVIPVVTALLAGPYEALRGDSATGPSLPDVLSFRKDALGKPMDEGLISALRTGAGVAHVNARELFAAARALYEIEPEAFSNGILSRKICETVAANAPAGTRGTSAASLEVLAMKERQVGESWLS